MFLNVWPQIHQRQIHSGCPLQQRHIGLRVIRAESEPQGVNPASPHTCRRHAPSDSNVS